MGKSKGRTKARKKGRSRYSARPAVVEWPGGVMVEHPSQVEARVARRLLAEVAAAPAGTRLFRQVRVPLLTLSPKEGGRPRVLTVDFAVVSPDNQVRLIDAKRGTRSRDWDRGTGAAEVLPAMRWPGVVEEVER